MDIQKGRNCSLNVNDPEAHRLARAISKATGETMTRVVTEALRERYERLQSRKGKASVEELLAIAKRALRLCEASLPRSRRILLRRTRPAEMILDTTGRRMIICGSQGEYLEAGRLRGEYAGYDWHNSRSEGFVGDAAGKHRLAQATAKGLQT